MAICHKNELTYADTDINIRIAASLKSKTKGLSGLDNISFGLFFPDEKGFHMIGMKQTIDVIIFRNNKIVALFKRARPTTGFGYHPFGTAMLELPAGTIDKLKIDKKTKIIFKK